MKQFDGFVIPKSLYDQTLVLIVFTVNQMKLLLYGQIMALYIEKLI